MKWILKNIAVKDLKENKDNPRRLTEKGLNDLEKSIKKFGVAEPLVVNTDLEICGGHGRKKILERLKIETVDCYIPEKKLTKKEFDELGIRLNKNIAGEFDFDILANNFEIDELLDWGFEEKDLDLNLWNDTDESKLDEVPEVQEKAISKLGDLFEIDGRHRVMCGDSLIERNIINLIDVHKIDFVFADPPYGIDVVSSKSKKVGGGGETKFGKIRGGNYVASNTYREIIGDSTIETAKVFYEVCKKLELKNIALWGGNYFTSFLPPSRCWLIWDKEMTGNFSEAEMAWTTFEKGGVRIFKHLWNGLSREGDRTVELKGRVHPTQKPVGMFKQIFVRFDYFKNIFDGFLGSGSTLIACEQTKRRCFGMELDPHYTDVILRRYINLYPEANIKCLNREFDFKKLMT